MLGGPRRFAARRASWRSLPMKPWWSTEAGALAASTHLDEVLADSVFSAGVSGLAEGRAASGASGLQAFRHGPDPSQPAVQARASKATDLFGPDQPWVSRDWNKDWRRRGLVLDRIARGLRPTCGLSGVSAPMDGATGSPGASLKPTPPSAPPPRTSARPSRARRRPSRARPPAAS